jgi:PKD repeat protein
MLFPSMASSQGSRVVSTTAYGPTGDDSGPSLETLNFPGGINTSISVNEYSQIARALMLNGGSTDSDRADVNGDGRTDLIVAVSQAKEISIFYRLPSGTFPSIPSLNISLERNPIAVRTLDAFAVGIPQIAVLERRNNASDMDYLQLFNITAGGTAYSQVISRMLYENPIGFVVGELTGDIYPDVTIAYEGPDPSNLSGFIEVKIGPRFSTGFQIGSGKGTDCIANGDFNGDTLLDVAVCNRYDRNVMVFHEPLSLGMPPSRILSVDGSPTALAKGKLDSDSFDDIVVATNSPSALHFYFQGLGNISETELYNRSLGFSPSGVVTGHLNNDSRDDVLVLSQQNSLAAGFYQNPTSPIWKSVPDFIFPTGDSPRSALIGQLDGTAGNEIAIASARSDWSGSSIGLYSRSQSNGFSNSNLTIWTNSTYEASAFDLGDINGDLTNDLILLVPALNSFAFMLDCAGDWQVVPLGYAPTKLVVKDVNDDGICEVVTSNSLLSDITISSWNSSEPSFFTSRALGCAGTVRDFEFGDFDDDGLIDLAVATAVGDLEVFYNDGLASAYSSRIDISVGASGTSSNLAVGDFNGDSKADVAVTLPSRRVGILLQNESGAPLALPFNMILQASAGLDFDKIWSGDLTGDGRADIAAMRPSDSSLYLFDQVDFETAPHPSVLLTFPEMPIFASIVDVTDDGFSDVLAIFGSADLLFLYKQDSGLLPTSPSMTFVCGGKPSCALIGDATQDHKAELLVSDSSSHSISVFEQANFAPIAHAGGPYTTMQGDLLRFNGSVTTGISELPFIEFNWDFGDGTSPTGWIKDSRPVHAYADVGNYTATLTVKDPFGMTDIDQAVVNVSDSIPHVDFTWTPLNPKEGETVTLNDTTVSYDPVVEYDWMVDNVTVSAGLIRTLTMEFDDGVHDVTLTAHDSDGSVANISKSFYVSAMNPELALYASGVVSEGDDVNISVAVDSWHNGPVDSIVLYEWDYSYNGISFLTDEETGTSNYTHHSFRASGTSQVYTVAVRATDIDGDWNLSAINIEVLDIGPTSSFSLSTPDPMEGIPFTFQETVVTWDGIQDWLWNLTYANGTQVSYPYNPQANGTAMVYTEFVLGNGDYVMSLQVTEPDGDTDIFDLAFTVREIPPFIELITLPYRTPINWYREFERVDFSAIITSYDPVVSYEWDFDAPGAQFISDQQTTQNFTHYGYNWTGNFTAKVRATDSDGSWAIQIVDIEIVDTALTGSFSDYVEVLRSDPNQTSRITFDATALAIAYPDISNTLWEFGDEARELITAPPSIPMVHTYDPIRNYEANITVTDDDGNNLVLRTTLLMIEPTLTLDYPTGDRVVRSGTNIKFLVDDDARPLVSVKYAINGGAFVDFVTLYAINTTGWPDGNYSIDVRAEDKDGNIAFLRGAVIYIDDMSPTFTITTPANSVYGGNKLNISANISDPHVDPSTVMLYVKFPGDSNYSLMPMEGAGESVYYRLVEVPMRSGEIEYYVYAMDLAGNSAHSQTYSVQVKLRFIDVAWPYMLGLAILAAVGTGAYFLREVNIAVDETFVVYNDGRMLAHSTRRLKPGMDDQVLSGMFVAIQDFIKDSFKDETSFTLRKLDFGEKSILIEKGKYLFLAVILHGKASRKVASKMKRIVDEIEERFAFHLIDWDGDLEKFRGLNDNVKRIYSKSPLLRIGRGKENT